MGEVRTAGRLRDLLVGLWRIYSIGALVEEGDYRSIAWLANPYKVGLRAERPERNYHPAYYEYA